MSKTDAQHYDAIVIGSGIGGLATASLLAQLGKKRVLVLERHFKLGGFTHSFRRKKYEWDIGVHYVGDMQDGGMARGIMDLVTRKGVKWQKMGSPYERFMFEEGTFEVPDGREAYQQKLIERFPDERANIVQYFKDLQKAQHWVARWYVSKIYSFPIDWLLKLGGKKLAAMTTDAYLTRIKDPLLRAFLASQWPDYGTQPIESAFGLHANVAADFFTGGFYPIGGSGQLALHACQAIEAYGGKCLVNHPVKQIDVHNNVATGVTVQHKGEELTFTAPMIISAAGASTTFGKLVPDTVCQPEREKVQRLKHGVSAIILFVGLNDDPRKHGFDDANYWIYNDVNHNRVPGVDAPPGSIEGGFVSFGSLRNPGQEPHTAQIISFSQRSLWDDFSGTAWKRRGREYDELKEKTSKDLVDFAERFMPGLANLIEYQELSTPLTVESFTGHPGGMIYGQACDPNRLFRDQWKIKTSLKNLYLTGSDVGAPGVNGALMAGVMTAAKMLGHFGLARIMREASKKS